MIDISLTQYTHDCEEYGLSPYGDLQANTQIIYGSFHSQWVCDSIGVKSILRLEMYPRPEDIRR